MKLEDYDNIYFLGIGGIGMSALARWFLKKGLNVSGYDRTSTKLTDELSREGMRIHFEDSLEMIPEEVLQQREKTLVIFTPAIPCEPSRIQLPEAGSIYDSETFRSSWPDHKRL